jgi:hypothetical protein
VSTHRVPLWIGSEWEFVTLACIMPVPWESVPLLHDRGDCHFRIDGSLKDIPVAEPRGPEDYAGFILTVESSLEFADGTSQPTNFSFQRVYGRQT